MNWVFRPGRRASAKRSSRQGSSDALLLQVRQKLFTPEEARERLALLQASRAYADCPYASARAGAGYRHRCRRFYLGRAVLGVCRRHRRKRRCDGRRVLCSVDSVPPGCGLRWCCPWTSGRRRETPASPDRPTRPIHCWGQTPPAILPYNRASLLSGLGDRIGIDQNCGAQAPFSAHRGKRRTAAGGRIRVMFSRKAVSETFAAPTALGAPE